MNGLLERERELAAVDELLECGRGVLVFEAGVGLGKTALLEAACRRAAALGFEVVRGRGSELEAEFAYGVVRQLFERRLAGVDAGERERLLAGPAAAARPLLLGELERASAFDTSFAVLHGLYWLAANLADRRPLLIAVDDAHWADEASLRWLAYLAPRLEGLALAILVARRPGEAAPTRWSLSAQGAESPVLRPALLSQGAVDACVEATLGGPPGQELRAAVWKASGGNPLYVTELLRALARDGRPIAQVDAAGLLAIGRRSIAQRVLARFRGVDPRALALAQAIAVLGDGCELRHAAAIAGLEMPEAIRLAGGLVRVELLAGDDPPQFIHPVVRDAVEASLLADRRDAAHRAAARVLHDEAAPPGLLAAHLMGLRPAADAWVLARLREAARAAMQTGAPGAAAALLARALSEPPPRTRRVDVLREAARAEVSAGRETAFVHLEEALSLADDPRERVEIALGIAESYAALFRWVDAVDVIERALAELGHGNDAFAARLEGELVVCGLHDARRAARVASVLGRLSSRSPAGDAVEAFAVARGMALTLAGRPVQEIGPPLEAVLAGAEPGAENWDTRAALLWSLAQALIDLLPQGGWPAGVGTVLIPAARGRLRLAQGRAAEALADFETCAAMFSPEIWGTEMRDVGYLHARSGAALALLRLGERERARELAQAELADVEAFGAPRARAVASRVAGLAWGGERGLALLEESVAALRGSPAALERAHSFVELGGALRRSGRRAAAREPLAEALDLAARCGARALAARARDELKATGARPRSEWRTGVEALTPSELRIVRLALEGHTNREIAHELYVTLKTVEGHLSRAYTKLGIEGRAQLRQAFGEEKTRVPTL